MPDGHPDGDDRQRQNARQNASHALRQGILWFAGYMLLLAASMFLPAGQLGWTEGWAFLVTYLVLMIAAILYLWRTNPDVVVARSMFYWKAQPCAQMITFVLLFVLFLAMFPVAALDGRFHWSRVPLWLTVVGYLLFLIGMAGNVWVLSANKFAEPSVRIQTERHQKVVDTGPYAIVRHPLYATACSCVAAFPWPWDRSGRWFRPRSARGDRRADSAGGSDASERTRRVQGVCQSRPLPAGSRCLVNVTELAPSNQCCGHHLPSLL